jgi:hypothetical protein
LKSRKSLSVSIRQFLISHGSGSGRMSRPHG